MGLSSSESKPVDTDTAEDTLFSYVDDKDQEAVALNLHNYDQMYQSWSCPVSFTHLGCIFKTKAYIRL